MVKKCKLHLYLHHSCNSQFHFHQSLTKTLQFLAKHGFPLLLLWLVMHLGFRSEGTPFITFPSLSFKILTNFKFAKFDCQEFSPVWQICHCHVYIISFSIHDRFTIITIKFLTLFEVHQNL